MPALGNFVVGDSLTNNNSWEGDLSALAIYRHEVTPEQVMMNVKSWVKSGHPEENVSGKPDALYLFDEDEGNLIHDRGSSGVNLSIPERYVVAQQILLDSPWNAFEPTWDYVLNILDQHRRLYPSWLHAECVSLGQRAGKESDCDCGSRRLLR